ncbi:MAG: hypothetical protein II119_04360 [Bacilli bacterium]|jgi:hypothetical protein|nr:hypothetical protein [Bacilli bacterium]MBQ6281975.1 hypothetical protein [Bacilli bacterium]
MNRFFRSRKFRLFLACISLFLLLDMVQDTYAKYVSSASASGNFTIAKWSFLVNNQDVLSNDDFSTTIIPTFDANANIRSGVISPTSTGYFDITIDSTNVDVAFDETITLSRSSTNTVTDLVFTGYKINNGNVVSLSSASPTITTAHSLNESTTVNTYRFYIEWQDGQGETMDNEDDTEATIDGEASIDVNLQFIQRATS